MITVGISALSRPPACHCFMVASGWQGIINSAAGGKYCPVGGHIVTGTTGIHRGYDHPLPLPRRESRAACWGCRPHLWRHTGFVNTQSHTCMRTRRVKVAIFWSGMHRWSLLSDRYHWYRCTVSDSRWLCKLQKMWFFVQPIKIDFLPVNHFDRVYMWERGDRRAYWAQYVICQLLACQVKVPLCCHLKLWQHWNEMLLLHLWLL